MNCLASVRDIGTPIGKGNRGYSFEKTAEVSPNSQAEVDNLGRPSYAVRSSW
jgi:hypothetical protein